MRKPSLFIGRVALVGTLSLRAAALAAPAATQPGGTEPDWVVKRTGLLVGWSPDGREIYLLERARVVNLWAVAVFYWPEAVAGTAGLLLAAWILKRWKRPQVAGEEYCRQCNYMLRNLESPRCPECGSELDPRNRVRGKSSRWRVGLGVALLLALAVGYGGGRTRLLRMGSVGQWFQWYSQTAAQWADSASGEWGDWLKLHAREVDQVMQAHVEGEQGLRHVCTVRNEEGEWFRQAIVSEDQRSLFGLNGNRDQIVEVELKSGRVVHWFKTDRVISGFYEITGAPPTLIAATEPTAKAWDVESGRSLGEAPVSDHFFLVGALEGRAVLWRGDKLMLWDPRTGVTQDCMQIRQSGFSGYGEGKVCLGSSGDRLEVRELIGGAKVGELPLRPSASSIVAGLHAGRILVDVDFGREAWVHDLKQKRTVTVVSPPSVKSSAWTLSADGKRLLQEVPGEFRVFDLERLQRGQWR